MARLFPAWHGGRVVRPLPCVTRVAGSNPGVVDFWFLTSIFFKFSIKIDSSIFLKGNSVWNFSASFELEWQQQPTLEAALNLPQLWQAFLSLKSTICQHNIHFLTLYVLKSMLLIFSSWSIKVWSTLSRDLQFPTDSYCSFKLKLDSNVRWHVTWRFPTWFRVKARWLVTFLDFPNFACPSRMVNFGHFLP